MREKKYFQWALVFVLISAALACNAPFAGSANITTTPAESVISVKLTLVTGNDGTADNPIFELLDNSGNALFTTTLNKQGDLQPNQTDIYEFSIPYSFCQITGWLLTKPSNSGVDDSWLPTEISIELDGNMVSFDRVFSDLGPIIVSSQRSENWAGTDIYKQQCGN